jgi:hypothetical protein
MRANTYQLTGDPANGGSVNYLPDPIKGVDFQGGRVSTLPGAATTAQEMARAEQAGKSEAQAPYTPVQMVGPDGRTPMVTTLDELVRQVQRTRANVPGAAVGQQGESRGFQTGEDPASAAARGANIGALERSNAAWVSGPFATVQTNAGVAAQTLNTVAAARKLLETSPQGMGSDTLVGIGRFMSMFGLADEKIAKYTSSAEAFGSIFSDAVLTKQLAQAGVQTESDARRMERTFAALKNTPQANAFILDYTEALAQVQQIKAEFYSRAHQRAMQNAATGRTPINLQQIDSDWRKVGIGITNMPSMRKWQ